MKSFRSLAAVAPLLLVSTLLHEVRSQDGAPIQRRATQAQRARVMTRARTHLARRQFAEAAKLLRSWTEKNVGDAEAEFLLAGALLTLGKVEEALERCTRSVDAPRFRAPTLYNIARIHAKKGAADASLKKLGEAREAGFADRARMYADAEFATLRSDARFQKLMPELKRGKDLFVEDVAIVHDILGESPGDQFGWVARRIGDVDGDGVVDFLTSAPTKTIGGKRAAGRVYAYSSKTGKLLWSVDGSRAGARLGNGLAGCGDLNGDGIPDVIVGAPGASRAVALRGDTGALLVELKGAPGEQFGTKACAIEDLDGDGRPELCVGAPGKDRVYVFDAKGKQRFVIEAPESAKGGQFGTALDGYLAVTCGLERTSSPRMLAVGAPKAQRSGRAYAFRMSAEGATLAFEITGDATSRNLGQYFVAVLRDCDGDGVEDVYASDWLNACAGPSVGRVFVHSGKTGKLLLTVSGKQPGEGFGTSMSQAGDVDGDGVSDLIVGAWQHRSAARSGGRCTLHSGKNGKVLATYTCRQPGDTFGFDAQGIGDVNGDGAIDFLCTSAWSPVNGVNTGRVVILAGPKL